MSLSKSSHTTLLLKGIAIFVAFCFTFTTLAWSALIFELPIHKNEISISPLADRIEIPESLGTVKERFISDRTTIIHIQDAHANYEAQVNTKKILEHLKKDYGMDLVFLEGGIGKFDPRQIQFLKDAEMAKRTANLLAQDGIVGGGELFMLDEWLAEQKRGQSPGGAVPFSAAYGVESPKLYRDNLDTFQEVIEKRNLSQPFLNHIQSRMITESSRVFNKKLKDFFKHWVFYQESAEQEWIQYIAFLYSYALEILNLDLKNPANQWEWPQLLRFFKLQELEKKISLEKNREDIRKLSRWLVRHGVSEHLVQGVRRFDSLQKAKNQNQWKEETPRHFLEKLYREMSPKGFSFKHYPYFSQKAGWTILQNELNATTLLSEMKRLTDLLLHKLTSRKEEQEILSLYRDFLLLKKLFSLELVNEDYEQVRKKEQEIKPSVLINRLHAAGSTQQAINFTCSMRPEACGMQLDSLFSKALAFYKIAKRRESVMFQKTISKMKELKKTNAILITGGFHSEGLLKQFKEQGISYVEITPHLSELTDNKNYQDLMTLQGDFLTLRSNVQTYGPRILASFGASHISRPRTDAWIMTAIRGAYSEFSRRYAGGNFLNQFQDEFGNSPAAKVHGLELKRSGNSLAVLLQDEKGRKDFVRHPKNRNKFFVINASRASNGIVPSSLLERLAPRAEMGSAPAGLSLQSLNRSDSRAEVRNVKSNLIQKKSEEDRDQMARSLIQKIKGDNISAAQLALNELLRSRRGLIANFVKRYLWSLYLGLPMSYDDLFGAAESGFMFAVYKFDPEGKVKFNTFIDRHMRNAILAEIDLHGIHIPTYLSHYPWIFEFYAEARKRLKNHRPLNPDPKTIKTEMHHLILKDKNKERQKRRLHYLQKINIEHLIEAVKVRETRILSESQYKDNENIKNQSVLVLMPDQTYGIGFPLPAEQEEWLEQIQKQLTDREFKLLMHWLNGLADEENIADADKEPPRSNRNVEKARIAHLIGIKPSQVEGMIVLTSQKLQRVIARQLRNGMLDEKDLPGGQFRNFFLSKPLTAQEEVASWGVHDQNGVLDLHRLLIEGIPTHDRAVPFVEFLNALPRQKYRHFMARLHPEQKKSVQRILKNPTLQLRKMAKDRGFSRQRMTQYLSKAIGRAIVLAKARHEGRGSLPDLIWRSLEVLPVSHLNKVLVGLQITSRDSFLNISKDELRRVLSSFTEGRYGRVFLEFLAAEKKFVKQDIRSELRMNEVDRNLIREAFEEIDDNYQDEGEYFDPKYEVEKALELYETFQFRPEYRLSGDPEELEEILKPGALLILRGLDRQMAVFHIYVGRGSRLLPNGRKQEVLFFARYSPKGEKIHVPSQVSPEHFYLAFPPDLTVILPAVGIFEHLVKGAREVILQENKESRSFIGFFLDFLARAREEVLRTGRWVQSLLQRIISRLQKVRHFFKISKRLQFKTVEFQRKWAHRGIAVEVLTGDLAKPEGIRVTGPYREYLETAVGEILDTGEYVPFGGISKEAGMYHIELYRRSEMRITLADALIQNKINADEFTEVIYPASGNYDGALLAKLKRKAFQKIKAYHLISQSYKWGEAGRWVKNHLLGFLGRGDSAEVFTYPEDYYQVNLPLSSEGKRIWIDKGPGDNAAMRKEKLYQTAVEKGHIRPGDMVLTVPTGIRPYRWKNEIARDVQIWEGDYWDNWRVSIVADEDIDAIRLSKKHPVERSELRPEIDISGTPLRTRRSELRTDSVAALTTALKSFNSSDRKKAVQTLGHWAAYKEKERVALNALLKTHFQNSQQVQVIAGLKEIGLDGKDAIKSLSDLAVQDRDPKVRDLAGQVLDKIVPLETQVISTLSLALQDKEKLSEYRDLIRGFELMMSEIFDFVAALKKSQDSPSEEINQRIAAVIAKLSKINPMNFAGRSELRNPVEIEIPEYGKISVVDADQVAAELNRAAEIRRLIGDIPYNPFSAVGFTKQNNVLIHYKDKSRSQQNTSVNLNDIETANRKIREIFSVTMLPLPDLPANLVAKGIEEGFLHLAEFIQRRISPRKPVIVSLFGGGGMGSSALADLIKQAGISSIFPEDIQIIEADDYIPRFRRRQGFTEYTRDGVHFFRMSSNEVLEQHLKSTAFKQDFKQASAKARLVVVTGVHSEYLLRQSKVRDYLLVKFRIHRALRAKRALARDHFLDRYESAQIALERLDQYFKDKSSDLFIDISQEENFSEVASRLKKREEMKREEKTRKETEKAAGEKVPALTLERFQEIVTSVFQNINLGVGKKGERARTGIAKELQSRIGQPLTEQIIADVLKKVIPRGDFRNLFGGEVPETIVNALITEIRSSRSEVRQALRMFAVRDSLESRRSEVRRETSVSRTSKNLGTGRSEVRSDKSLISVQDSPDEMIPLAIQFLDGFLNLRDHGVRFEDETGDERLDLTVPREKEGESAKSVEFNGQLILSTDVGDFNAYETEVPVLVEFGQKPKDVIGVSIALAPDGRRFVRLQALHKTSEGTELAIDPKGLILDRLGRPFHLEKLTLRTTIVDREELDKLYSLRAEVRVTTREILAYLNQLNQETLPEQEWMRSAIRALIQDIERFRNKNLTQEQDAFLRDYIDLALFGRGLRGSLRQMASRLASWLEAKDIFYFLTSRLRRFAFSHKPVFHQEITLLDRLLVLEHVDLESLPWNWQGFVDDILGRYYPKTLQAVWQLMVKNRDNEDKFLEELESLFNDPEEDARRLVTELDDQELSFEKKMNLLAAAIFIRARQSQSRSEVRQALRMFAVRDSRDTKDVKIKKTYYQRVFDLKGKRSEVRSLASVGFAHHFRAKSIAQYYPKVFLRGPAYRLQPGETSAEMPKGINAKKDLAQARKIKMLDLAIVHLRRQGRRLNDPEMIRRAAHLAGSTTILGLDMPTHLLFYDLRARRGRVYHLDRRRGVIYFPLRFLDSVGRDLSGIEEIAVYLDRAQRWLDAYQAFIREQTPASVIYKQMRESEKNFPGIDREILGRDPLQLLVRISELRALDEKIQEKEIFPEIEKLRLETSGFNEKLEKKRKSRRPPTKEEYSDLALRYGRLAHLEENVGRHDDAIRSYRFQVAQLHSLQTVDTGLLPFQIQERIIMTLLLAGLHEEFLQELRVFLTGEGWPRKLGSANRQLEFLEWKRLFPLLVSRRKEQLKADYFYILRIQEEEALPRGEQASIRRYVNEVRRLFQIAKTKLVSPIPTDPFGNDRGLGPKVPSRAEVRSNASQAAITDAGLSWISRRSRRLSEKGSHKLSNFRFGDPWGRSIDERKSLVKVKNNNIISYKSYTEWRAAIQVARIAEKIVDAAALFTQLELRRLEKVFGFRKAFAAEQGSAIRPHTLQTKQILSIDLADRLGIKDTVQGDSSVLNFKEEELRRNSEFISALSQRLDEKTHFFISRKVAFDNTRLTIKPLQKRFGSNQVHLVSNKEELRKGMRGLDPGTFPRILGLTLSDSKTWSEIFTVRKGIILKLEVDEKVRSAGFDEKEMLMASIPLLILLSQVPDDKLDTVLNQLGLTLHSRSEIRVGFNYLVALSRVVAEQQGKEASIRSA